MRELKLLKKSRLRADFLEVKSPVTSRVLRKSQSAVNYCEEKRVKTKAPNTKKAGKVRNTDSSGKENFNIPLGFENSEQQIERVVQGLPPKLSKIPTGPVQIRDLIEEGNGDKSEFRLRNHGREPGTLQIEQKIDGTVPESKNRKLQVSKKRKQNQTSAVPARKPKNRVLTTTESGSVRVDLDDGHAVEKLLNKELARSSASQEQADTADVEEKEQMMAEAAYLANGSNSFNGSQAGSIQGLNAMLKVTEEKLTTMADIPRKSSAFALLQIQYDKLKEKYDKLKEDSIDELENVYDLQRKAYVAHIEAGERMIEHLKGEIREAQNVIKAAGLSSARARELEDKVAELELSLLHHQADALEYKAKCEALHKRCQDLEHSVNDAEAEISELKLRNKKSSPAPIECNVEGEAIKATAFPQVNMTASILLTSSRGTKNGEVPGAPLQSQEIRATPETLTPPEEMSHQTLPDEGLGEHIHSLASPVSISSQQPLPISESDNVSLEAVKRRDWYGILEALPGFRIEMAAVRDAPAGVYHVVHEQTGYRFAFGPTVDEDTDGQEDVTSSSLEPEFFFKSIGEGSVKGPLPSWMKSDGQDESILINESQLPRMFSLLTQHVH